VIFKDEWSLLRKFINPFNKVVFPQLIGPMTILPHGGGSESELFVNVNSQYVSHA
jgi:hypothetical protein